MRKFLILAVMISAPVFAQNTNTNAVANRQVTNIRITNMQAANTQASNVQSTNSSPSNNNMSVVINGIVQVKMFTAANGTALENDINDWMMNTGMNYSNINDIKIFMSNQQYTAMIIYSI